MKRITTVCGDIAPEELGFTDMHEHIMFNGADMGAICRPAMPTDLPVKYEDKVSLGKHRVFETEFSTGTGCHGSE